MHRSNLLAIVRLCLGVALCGAPAMAQQHAPPDLPFSKVVVTLSLLLPLDIGELAPYYATRPGGMIQASTPFNVGEIGVDAGWLSFSRQRAPGELPASAAQDFRALLVGLHWNAPHLNLGRVQTTLGARAGTLRMMFKDRAVDDGIRTEDELQLGLTAHAQFSVTRRFFVSGNINASRVFLHVPLTLVTTSVGVAWHYPMPDRIREWLR